jgi:PAS domain S-box-containing protein
METPRAARPTGRERFFDEGEVIVSKTDLKGVITYANGVFLRVAGYGEEEILGRPHNIIRHPDMPRCVFKLLWDKLAERQEVFAYVVNLAKNGDHYWVFAHVTPSLDHFGNVVGYHSNRRVPARTSVEAAGGLYAELLAEERRHADWRAGMAASGKMLLDRLDGAGMPYEEFVFAV